jgi:hypothetical protein
LPSEIQTHIQEAVQSIDKHAPLFDQIQPHEPSRWRHS